MTKTKVEIQNSGKYWKPTTEGDEITGIYEGIGEGEYKGEKTEHVILRLDNGELAYIGSNRLVRTLKPEYENKRIWVTFLGLKMFGNMQGRDFELSVDL